MSDADSTLPSGRRETPEERADRNLLELLGELRVRSRAPSGAARSAAPRG